MRRYTITINGTEHVVDVAEHSAETFTVTVDGIDVAVRMDDHQDLAQAEISPAITSTQPVPRGSSPAPRSQGVDSVAGGQVPSTASLSKKTATTPVAPTPAAGASDSGDAMKAPMPGVVLSVDAAPGQAVSRGDLILVLEAMKMKNEIRASHDGQIAEIPVAAGDQVKFGDTLVRFA